MSGRACQGLDQANCQLPTHLLCPGSHSPPQRQSLLPTSTLFYLQVSLRMVVRPASPHYGVLGKRLGP
jgi:hypothetical protein